MNKLRLITVFFLGALLLCGCQKWGEPDFKANEWDPPAGTMASQFWTINSRNVLGNHIIGNPPDSLTSYKDRYLRYIRAVVVSSDEGGNYYKSMVIQDATGGVELELDMTGLHNIYPVGQKIILICNGLVIGDYNNLPQIGWIYNETQVGRINSLFFDKYIIKDGLPSPRNLPKILTNKDIDFLSDVDVNKLVRLEGVKFLDNAIGNPLSYNDFTTDWKVAIPFENGDTIITVRTSNFAKFRSTIIENKKYNLTGILTKYRSTYQLMIRTKEDIEVVNEVINSLVFDFSKNPIGEGNWSTQSLSGSQRWGFRNNSIMHQANQTGNIVDDWFISPLIEFQDFAQGYLHFQHQLNVLNKQYDAYQIYYTTSTSTDFDPDEWLPLGNLESFPPNFEWSNSFPLSKINSSAFRIAFRYYVPDPEIETYIWSIAKMEIYK